MARAWALNAAGKAAEALALAQAAIVEVRAIPHPRTEAELLSLASLCHDDLGNTDGAFAATQDAFTAALAAADYPMAVRAAAGASFDLFDRLGRSAEGERWLAVASAIAQTLPHDDALELAILRARISAQHAGTDRDREAAERQVVLARRVYGERSPQLASAHLALGIEFQVEGRLSDAIDASRRAIAMFEAIGGPTSAKLIIPYGNLASICSTAHRYEEAQAALERAFTLTSQPCPSDLRSWLFSVKAKAELRQERGDAALEVAEEGLRCAPASASLSKLLFVRARARALHGDVAASATECAKVVRDQEAGEGIGPDKVYHDDAVTCLGEAELKLGRVEEALAHLERSVQLERRWDPGDLPAARFALARALRAARRDAPRARTLAESARAAFERLGSREREIADIDAFLAVTH
jgi:tetratricopeptide (TPR) repeat protein